MWFGSGGVLVYIHCSGGGVPLANLNMKKNDI